MELCVAPDGRVLFLERGGQFRIWKPDIKQPCWPRSSMFFATTMDQSWWMEDGLLGIQLAPGFVTNHWIYLYYSPKDVSENRLSRFV